MTDRGRQIIWECWDCHNRFSSEQELRRHTKINHGDFYRCIDCGATFNSDKQLTEHKLFHIAAKASQAPITAEQVEELMNGEKQPVSCPHGMSSRKWCDICTMPSLRDRIIEETPDYDEEHLTGVAFRGIVHLPVLLIPEHLVMPNTSPVIYGTMECDKCGKQVVLGQRFIELQGTKAHFHPKCLIAAGGMGVYDPRK